MTVAAAEPLARHTTFRIGGPADLYATANNIAQLERLAESAHAHAIPTTILGGGSNILVSDAGIRGLVIANQTRGFGSMDGERRTALVGRFGRGLAGSGPLGHARTAGRGWNGR